MKIKNNSKHIANDVGVDAHIDPKNQNAITLIALVVTIIVLLILAGVSLNLVLGEEGISQRAVNTRKVHETQETIEKIKLAISSAQIKDLGKIDKNTLKQDLTDYFGTDFKIAGNSKEGYWITIPKDEVAYYIKPTGEVEEIDDETAKTRTDINLQM